MQGWKGLATHRLLVPAIREVVHDAWRPQAAQGPEAEVLLACLELWSARMGLLGALRASTDGRRTGMLHTPGYAVRLEEFISHATVLL